jgi:hypothetical protein
MDVEDADALVVREVFGRVDAQAALPALLAVVERWRPDLVVRETAEIASVAAGRRERLLRVRRPASVRS